MNNDVNITEFLIPGRMLMTRLTRANDWDVSEEKKLSEWNRNTVTNVNQLMINMLICV